MPQQTKAEPAATDTPQQPTPQTHRPPLKAIVVIAAIMLVEAGGVLLLVGALGPKPQEAAAEIHGEQPPLEGSVEIELVDERFQNMQSGRVWSWEIGVFLKVKKKHEDFVNKQLEDRNAEIKEGVSQIIRRAQHVQLKEPELTTLNRQIRAFLDKTLGTDAEGNSRIERVMIPKCKGLQLEN